jgi:hypothetical protein
VKSNKVLYPDCSLVNIHWEFASIYTVKGKQTASFYDRPSALKLITTEVLDTWSWNRDITAHRDAHLLMHLYRTLTVSRFSIFLWIYTSDRPVAMPLPKCRTTQTQKNAHTHTHTPNIHGRSGIRNHNHSDQASEDSTVTGRTKVTLRYSSWQWLSMINVAFNRPTGSTFSLFIYLFRLI